MCNPNPAQSPKGPVDPGVRGGPPGAGGPLTGLTADETAFFQDGQTRFAEVEVVANGANNGLGPRFNSNQCLSCHSQPSGGGTSPLQNPLIAVAALNGAKNMIPWFITQNGPVREARFKLNSNGTSDGGVHALFVITGRNDAHGCNIAQPDFLPAGNPVTGQGGNSNIIFRIPTPVFGTGLIEAISDSAILANMNANASEKSALGISGHPNAIISGTANLSANDGTITRFGWKAQNKSGHIFAGEAYNVEMGITNELFNNERPLPEEDQLGLGLPATCLNLTGTGYPEDTSNPLQTTNAAVLDDVSAFANFMRFLAPPPPGGVTLQGTAVPAATIAAGQALFTSIGCATCHNPSPGKTQVSNFVAELSNQAVPAYSDFEIHDMGTALADNVSQGNAGGDQFRTAPLWGLGQRIFLNHDGRNLNLNAVIQEHSSNGSEANTVVTNFQDLNSTQQQELFDFLRSL